MNQQNAYIDAATCAELLGFSTRHVSRLCTIGKVRGATKKGNHWQIPLNAVDQFQAEQRQLVMREAKVLRLLKPYTLLYVGTVSAKMREAGEEFLELQSQPVLDDWTKKRLCELEEALEGLSCYQRRILRDVELAEKSAVETAK